MRKPRKDLLGCNLRMIKSQLGLSDEKFAAKLRITKETLNEYLDGWGDPHLHTLIRFAGILKCKVTDLLKECR
ncbi:MAG TPA: helix-turn-helix transcriptional regulator [Candidatus Paceibacterota bacterium]|nr:helix-turn-helix transcriptional regulator [Candidatus Paceibacterota bacterium]